jgi:hypothetical protein
MARWELRLERGFGESFDGLVGRAVQLYISDTH